jgi:hypothetical protein
MSVENINRKPVAGLAFGQGFAALLAVALLLFAVSCGGGSFALQDDLNTNNGNPAPLEVSGSELPALPVEGNGIPSRGASAVTTISGSSAIMFANGEIVDTTLVLSSPELAPEPGQDIAWGLYQVSGLAGKRVTSLAVSAIPGDLGQTYSVGVSNFSDGVWDFLQSTSLPEFEYDLTDEESRLVSRLGNLYFIVVVSSGDSVTVVEASVLSEDDPTGGTGTPPAIGGRPQASEGLSDRIVVTWEPIDGAESYELWRAEDIEGVDEEFSIVATQAELIFTDFDITLSTEYHYKVRGINTAGPGLFGRKDSGWAGAVPPEGEGEEFGEKEVFGAIEAIDAGSLTVNGTVFAIDEDTRFVNDNGLPADPAEFTVGTLIQVHGKSDGADGWIATRVKLEDMHFGQEREVQGTIEAINETEIVVNGESFGLNASTEWMDDNNNLIDPSNFTVGTFVEVDAYSDGNGGWLAEKVKLDDGQGGAGTSETGNIEALDETAITVNGVVFAHNESTEWLDNNNNPLTPADFSVGMFVKVEADPDGEGGWIAYKVKMEDQGEGQSHDELGNIQELTETTITVNDVVFTITEQTEWLGLDNEPLTAEDFSVGELVKVEGTVNGEQIDADKVKKEN